MVSHSWRLCVNCGSSVILRFRVSGQASGFRVRGLGFEVRGSRFRVWGLGFQV